MISSDEKHRFGRRGFLFQASALTASTLYSKAFATPLTPSACVTLGFIGTGNRGTQMLPVFLNIPDVRILAICDVRRDNRERAKATTDAFYGNTDCTAYRDYRELLARQDIDAVYIATGDRWHAQMSILAMQAGKDVYCEKPISLSIQETLALLKASKHYGRIFQAGCQRRNVGNFKSAIAVARDFVFHGTKTLHAGMTPMGTSLKNNFLPEEPLPDRNELDWELWLGPAPWRPYNKGYLKSWRHERDFHGDLTEWGCHTVDLCLLVQGYTRCGERLPFPVMTFKKEHEDRLELSFGFKSKIVLRSKGFKGSCAVRFENTVNQAWVETDDSGEIAIHDDYRFLLGNRAIKSENWMRSVGHTTEFIASVKSRLTPSAPVKEVFAAHVCCHAANVAYELGRPLTMDPRTFAFKDDPEANRLLYRPCRAPWTL